MFDHLQRILADVGILDSHGCSIFISYRRRGEGAGYAGRLADRLIHEFGAKQCFRDIDDIESGTDFVDAISKAVGSCKVLVVVIAPDWLDTRDADGRRRLDNPQDFVRIEIAAALARNVRVVPVLVGGARMPAPEQLPGAIEGFARRQAHELSDTRWDYDVGQLVTTIEGLGVKRISSPAAAATRRRLKIATAAGAAMITVALAAAQMMPDDGGGVGFEPQPKSASNLPPAAEPGQEVVAEADVKAATPPQRLPAPETSVPVAREPAPRYDPVAAERPAILAAMRRANQAETHALHQLDVSGLGAAFVGDALQREIAAVQELLTLGIHAVGTLHAQHIESIRVSSDGEFAEVDAVEEWSVEYHRNVDDGCAARTPRHDVPQTVTLVRAGGGWMVANLEMHGTSPDPEPCY